MASVLPARAQKNGQKNDATAAATAVQDATKKGFPLSASSTDVTGSISVEATLIPAKIAKTVFGKEVANNYAVIALTVSNRSADNSFIVHNVFIDYSQWLLSGDSPYLQQYGALCSQGAQGAKAPADQQSEQGQAQPNCIGNRLQQWQLQTFDSQIDSVETRIVRGELLDRQPWTTRNWALRALQTVGSVASGFTFATSNDGWIRGIGAYNGSFIPAAQTLWPDATVAQMNRISDLGFQVNKVIAKQSSDIVVAFFPIDRFLTPGLKSIFLSSPAAFFAPFTATVNPATQKSLTKFLGPIFPKARLDNLVTHLSEVTAGACKPFDPKNPPGSPESLEQACQTVTLLNHLSLNVVRVIVGGTLTVDVNKIPPQITAVEIDQDKDANQDGTVIWKKDATLTGVIRGSFLGGGTPTITKPQNVMQVTAVAEGSTDTELHFTIKLNQDLPAGTTVLTFQVSKKSDSSTTPSATHDYLIVNTPKAAAAASAKDQGAGNPAPPKANPQPAVPAEKSNPAPKKPGTGG